MSSPDYGIQTFFQLKFKMSITHKKYLWMKVISECLSTFLILLTAQCLQNAIIFFEHVDFLPKIKIFFYPPLGNLTIDIAIIWSLSTWITEMCILFNIPCQWRIFFTKSFWKKNIKNQKLLIKNPLWTTLFNIFFIYKVFKRLMSTFIMDQIVGAIM